jgi:helix-turn-helix protein
MSCFLYVDDEENNRKINIDELYENNKKRDMKQLSIFNKILNRIHKRIQFVGRNKRDDKHIWFTVPEYIFGEPLYDKGENIGYLVSKLKDNGFTVKYIHPNTLFISWHDWVPSYVRSEIKKKTGLIIDEKGNTIKKVNDEDEEENNDSNYGVSTTMTGQSKSNKNYTPIGQYKPTGNLVYNPEYFEKLSKRMV